MAHSTVPRHPWRSAEASELLASNQPVVLTDCPLIATLAGRWEFATLSDLCGTHELGVHTTPAGTQTFARHYGRGLGVGTIRPMTFAAFADACAAHLAAQSSSGSDSEERYYLQAPLRWTDEHGEPRAAWPGREAQSGPRRATSQPSPTGAGRPTVDHPVPSLCPVNHATDTGTKTPYHYGGFMVPEPDPHSLHMRLPFAICALRALRLVPDY